jgi:NAD-dependent DNA ligase
LLDFFWLIFGLIFWFFGKNAFPPEVTDTQCNNITQMIQKWIDENDNRDLPADLTKLASGAGIVVSNLVVNITDTTPWRQYKQEKAKQPTTPSVAGSAMEGALSGLWFVLTGVWPSQGGGRGLTLGKERVKAWIEKIGGSVTKSISGVTNLLVTGENPGKKKVIEAHEKRLKIINIKQMNGLILGDFTLDDLTISNYPKVVTMVLDAKMVQVQRHPQSSVQQEQA